MHLIPVTSRDSFSLNWQGIEANQLVKAGYEVLVDDRNERHER